jgi:hypothetical protein
MAQGITLTGYKQPSKRRHKRHRSRRNRLLTRMLPLIVFALVGFGFGWYEAGAAGRSERALVARYVTDWANADYTAMYSMLSPAAKQQISMSAFEIAYANASATATVTSLHGGNSVSISQNVARESITVHTSVFGKLHELIKLPLAGDGDHLRWVTSMVFPGLRAGERLRRISTLGTRGSLLASNGEVLAQGSSLNSPIPEVAGEVVGNLGPIPAPAAAGYAAEGYPAGAQVGQDGLELIFQTQLAGRPGGILYAGKRILATAQPINGQTVKTTINPSLEADAINVQNRRDRGRRRNRLHSRPAAGLDLQDHHRNRRPSKRAGNPKHRLPLCRQRDA